MCYNRYMDNTKYFNQVRSTREGTQIFFGDWPFAVSVYCDRQIAGYNTDWVVSGVRKVDGTPRFLLRLQMGVRAERAELEDACMAMWKEQIEELAFAAAIQGGQDLPTNAIPKSQKDARAEWHLFAHERFGDFDKEAKTLTERTANLFNLLKSLGYIQAQKMITKFEIDNSETEMKPSTISRRLHMARQAGLIPHLIDKSEWTYPDDFEE